MKIYSEESIECPLSGCKKLIVTHNFSADFLQWYWWPADTPFEVMVGAILTQNTALSNVEKALARFEGDLSPDRILALPEEDLQELIRPAGFFRPALWKRSAASS